jgi:hypothetical protein
MQSTPTIISYKSWTTDVVITVWKVHQPNAHRHSSVHEVKRCFECDQRCAYIALISNALIVLWQNSTFWILQNHTVQFGRLMFVTLGPDLEHSIPVSELLDAPKSYYQHKIICCSPSSQERRDGLTIRWLIRGRLTPSQSAGSQATSESRPLSTLLRSTPTRLPTAH